ncbi:hypothetical protein [Spirosoma foliorum]|uniref:Uncharacterized protein n=1 Tax=Spirosoma foliorum TaxID=2710596 RepID=A0A7G5H2M1_9BACT|nr:hypothetical protein [Spirosoma foliorum]QMW05363.1 hypothetical protein H3H32_10960 [Spirosoma foliorum]
MTHKELVKAAYRWVLGSTSCGMAIRELASGARNGEYPDVIGFGAGMSVLVECKASRSDFFADRKKLFRQYPEMGMGTYRFYCCPTGLLTVEDLPEKWGLIYVNEKGKNRTIFNPYNGNKSDYSNVWSNGFVANIRAEQGIMYSVLRRLHKSGHVESIYRNGYEDVEDLRQESLLTTPEALANEKR